VDGGYASRRAACESVAAKLNLSSLRDLSSEVLFDAKSKLTDIEFRRARHAVSEMQRVLDAVRALELADFSLLGHLINDSHTSLRDDYEVSCPELDLSVETAVSEGALGARMVGGGFGGSAIALVNSEDAKRISIAIENAFAKMNFEAPRFFASLPSQGAQIIQRR
jgi:galactokinase